MYLSYLYLQKIIISVFFKLLLTVNVLQVDYSFTEKDSSSAIQS